MSRAEEVEAEANNHSSKGHDTSTEGEEGEKDNLLCKTTTQLEKSLERSKENHSWFLRNIFV